MFVTLTGHSESEFPAEKFAEKADAEAAKANMHERHIPSGSVYRIESISLVNNRERRALAEKGTASHSIQADLHVGKYVYSLRRRTPEHDDDVKFCNYFYVGMDEKTFRRFGNYRPKNFRRMQTSKGIEFRCNWANCREVFTHMTAAVLHEMEDHEGRDPLGRKKAAGNGQGVKPEAVVMPVTHDVQMPVVRKKRGRPKGAKNKKAAAVEA